jgi:23S rRNA pseudouridine1911/1915/1917 synthase
MSDIGFRIEQADAGARLDAVVAARAGLPRAQAARLIADGAVTVDGVAVSKSWAVREGATVIVRLPPVPGPPEAEDVAVTVVYEDEALLIVSKPAGLVVHPAPGHARGTLVNALLARGAAGGDPERPGIVHRLDAGTSGLMVVAKGQAAYEALAAAMAAREVTRTYIALTERLPETDTVTIDAPIGRSARHRKKMGVVPGGKPARTEVAVLERHPVTALVEARPITGRTHQIRVHLLAAGMPVAGDPVYGRDRALARALDLSRPFLHAVRLSFRHPVSGIELDLSDPLPEDLVATLDRARVHPK